ncbi:hypothetical protein DFH07DRAFT_707732, partial [Mycena maculata]
GDILKLKMVLFDRQMANDTGSEAYQNLASWGPPAEGWHYLGQCASNNYTDSPISLVFKPLAAAPGLLAAVERWEQVWNNSGSSASRDFALWRGVSSSETHVVVGGIFSANPGHAHPTAEQTEGIVAINSQLVAEDGATRVWDDLGSGAKEDGSVW